MKVQGNKDYFELVRQERNRTIVSYGFEEISGTDATWYEVYFYKKKDGIPTFKMAKDAILNDINEQTDYKILTGFVWNDINVWLSAENQRNFSEAQRMAAANPSILPVTFKLGEDEEENPIYHTFESVAELDGFYLQAFGYINQCLNEGWQRKDSIDWDAYKPFFPEEPLTESE